MGISSLWTKHLKDPKKAEDFEKALRHDTLVLGRLQEILEDKIRSASNAEIAKEAYDKPNWPYYQADLIGMKRAYKEILDLIKIKDSQ